MAKRAIIVATALMALVSFAATDGAGKASLASARAKITQVIEKPSLMAEVMKSLSEDDQVAFLAEVNAAIAAMPGDAAERTAMFVAVNNAALAGAQKGNALALVAEVFATVPPYALTAVGESLSTGLMNRAADKSVTYTDEQYVRIVQIVMAKVNERVSSENNAGVRSALAGLMLINASNGASAEMIDAVVATLPESVRNDAKTEWYPAALAKNGEKSYDSLMAAVEGDVAQGEVPLSGTVDSLMAIRVSAAQNFDGILADIVASSSDPLLTASEKNPIVDALQNPLNYHLPNGVGDTANDTATIINRVNQYIEGDGYPFQYYEYPFRFRR